MRERQTRREFLQVAAAAGVLPLSLPRGGRPVGWASPGDRPSIGAIGVGGRGMGITRGAMRFGDVVAVCDVDANRLARARAQCKKRQGRNGREPDVIAYENYRRLLDLQEIDVVMIGTTDHWHTKIAIDAMRAGKDVYCEKPLTLTIEEGQQILEVLGETKRVFQVGTQQRSEMGQRFLKAIAIIRDGRIGEVEKVVCNIGKGPSSPALAKAPVPAGLNWDMWLGQAPMVDYIAGSAPAGKNKRRKPRRYSRGHYTFRWWLEYSGGKMTDWGAHHVDIAQWAIGMERSGPVRVEATGKFPVPFRDGHPTVDNRYNTPTEFTVDARFENGVDLQIVSSSPDGNGIRFTGTKGTFFVSRGKLKGEPVERLREEPLPEGAIEKVYGGKPVGHVCNFMDCVKSRKEPVSDVYTHHRAMTTCHLANIALRLGRPIQWDPEREQIVGDDEARAWQRREQRKGYEIEV